MESLVVKNLEMLDLPVLVEMLSRETNEYLIYSKLEGHTARTEILKESVQEIQKAIEKKIHGV